MLQKAATNAYSWWWASHIRTKQSKWLEQNLQDTEEKVTDILEIVDNDGDSFAQRAEMYYNKRSDLLNSLEEVFRSYRSLAVRYDHLSKDLQSANRTIASVFPDQLPYAMEDEDEDTQISDKTGLPKARSLKKDVKKQSMFLSKKGQPKKAGSGMNKEEALEEIDKLQKEMLALQTEREFMKSSYENGYKKFSEIENQINEKQERVYELQDEFAIASVIDDDEGRALMATQALKTCQESLDTLKEKHEQSTEDVRIESERVRNESQKFEALRNKFNSLQTGRQEKPKLVRSTTKPDSMAYGRDDTEASDQQEKRDCTSSTTVDDEAKESVDVEALRKEIEEKLQVGLDESLTMPQLAENIDELVIRVIRLETAVLSEKTLVKRLKSEADELQEHVKILEEDKEALIEGSDATIKKINELEAELSQVKDLVKTVIEQNISLKAHFTEAICNLNNLSVKLQKFEATRFSQDVKCGPYDAEEHETIVGKGTEEHETEVGKGTKEHETEAGKGTEEHETQAGKGTEEHGTKAGKGTEGHETKADKGNEEHETKADKGNEEHETKAGKGIEEHETNAGKGTEEHETEVGKGTKEHETEARKGTEEHETKADEGTEEHETKADKGTEERETKADEGTEERETKAGKGTEERETKAGKGTEEHETKASEGTEEHETKAGKGTEERETKASKGTEERETKASKGTEEPETKAGKGTEERETKAGKGTEEHETEAGKGTEEHETKAGKGTEEHEIKAGKGTEQHKTKADKGTEEHKTKADKGTEQHETELASDDNSSLKDTGTKSKEKGKNVSAEGEKNVGPESGYKVDDDLEKGRELLGKNKDDKKHLSETASSVPDSEVEELKTDEEEQRRQLYLNGLDDREKISTDEYSSLLKNYKEVRKKLHEVDKKNRTGLFESALLIKELRSAVASRDGTIQSLRRKLSFADENEDGNSVEDEGPRRSTSPESDLTDYIQQSPIKEENDDDVVEQTAKGRLGGHFSAIEDQIRSGIDELLEENLEFWLRFSTSVHQIQKYQNSVQDLKAELSKLREKMNKEEGENEQSMKSVARPIYCHLREIRTELTLWLENNQALKEQVHDRNLSLCNFQDEIARVTDAKNHGEETGISVYETAKFQGEVLNMKQEIKKVGKELKASFARARQLKLEVEKVMAGLEKEIRSAYTSQSQSKTPRSRLPLQSFLFGVKLKNKKKTPL